MKPPALVSRVAFAAIALLASPAFSMDFLPSTYINLANSAQGEHFMTTGDLNHDGHADIAIVDWASNVADVLLARPSGGFGPIVRIPTPSGPFSVALADLNQDTHLDMVIVNRVASSLSVCLGDGTGAFLPRVDYGLPVGPSIAVVGDVTGDGFLDVVAAADLNVFVLAGNGLGQLGAPVTTVLGTSLPASQTWGIALGDLDGDGDLDVVTNFYGPLVELRNTGNGTFTRQDFGSNIGSRMLAVVDIDGDGDQDVVAPSELQDGIIVFMGDGAGNLVQNPVIPTGVDAQSLSIADLNHDGRLDVVTGNVGSNTVSVLRGTASGLQPEATIATAKNPTAVAVMDLNGDSDLDFVDTGYSGLLLFHTQGPVQGPPDPSEPDGNWHELPPLGKLAYEAGAYDPSRQYLWIFGGFRWRSTKTNEVWIYDFSSGTTVSREVTVAGVKPSPRSGHQMILDTVHDRLIVFGGDGTNQVWALSLSGTPTWTLLSPSGTPPIPRWGMLAVFDSARDRMIVFGGQDGTGALLNDVWALSLDASPAWTQIVPTGPAPTPRSGTSGVYDPVGDRVIIAGGAQGSTPMNDTWSLSLSSPAWTLLTAGASGGNAVAVFDPIRYRIVRLGGGTPCPTNETQTLDLASPFGWATLGSGTTVVRSAHIAVYDAVQDRILLHGGWAGYPCTGAKTQYFDDLQALSLGASPSWIDISPTSHVRPARRSRPLMAYVPARREAIVFGGHHGYLDYSDVWRLDLSGSPAWQPLAPAGTPPAGPRGTSVTYDPVRERLIFLSGVNVFSLTLVPTLAWQPLSVSGPSPPPRAYRSAIYDPIGDRIIVFGGNTGDGWPYPNPGTMYNDVWQLNLSEPMTWSQILPSGTPPAPRYQHGAIYDPVRERMVVFGGLTGLFIYNSETWELSLGASPAWTQILPLGAPPSVSRSDNHPVYDSTRDRLVFFDDVHTYQLTLGGVPAWIELPILPGVPMRDYAGTIYDSGGDRMVAYGGISPYDSPCPSCPPPDLADLWTLNFAHGPTSVEPGIADAPTIALRAYPNPSASLTTLEFTVPSKRAATVRIYDVSGRLVRDVFTGSLPAGVQRTEWDGRDAGGKKVMAGLYFVRAKMGDVEYRRTIVRIR